MYYSVVGTEDGSNITVFITGHDPLVAHSSHPNFGKILERVLDNDPSVADLFDVAQTAADRFQRLTERVTTANGRLYFDGEEVHNSLATQVCRFLSEGVEDWKPLVRFFDNVQQNPSEHSREFLYDWLDRNEFQITESGMIVGYKGVESLGNGLFQSQWTGKAIVDGEVKTGKIPQWVGAVVEMPRSEVHFDTGRACSEGLHAATWGFAQGYNRGAILELHINPRDVVSVPTESGGEKFRCCRYLVVGTLDAPYSAPVVGVDYEYDDDYSWGENNLCDECGMELGWDCNCDDGEPKVYSGLDAPMTPRQFHANVQGSVDNSWREWKVAYPNHSMTRDEFRAAVKQ